MSASSSKELNKYEYLALLCNVFNKGLKENDKKEGLLKKLKSIEDKNEE